MNRTVIRDPTTEERETLRQWESCGKIAWYQRARTILLAADDGMDVTAIAHSLALHPNTTRRWLHTFDREGLPVPAPQPKGGSCGLGAEGLDRADQPGEHPPAPARAQAVLAARQGVGDQP